MAVTTQNLFFTLGDSYTFSCLAQDYDQNVINLTGAGILCTAKPSANSDSYFLGTDTVTSAALGTFTINFPPSATASLPNYPQTWEYSVIVTKSGASYTVQSGLIYLTPQI